MRSDSQEALLQQRNEIVGASGAVLALELELLVQGFQFITRRIHGSIFPQNLPVVKGKVGDLGGIHLVCLAPADGNTVLI